MRNFKSITILLIIFLTIILITLLLETMAFSSASVTCARFTRQASSKGAWYSNYIFEIEGKIVEGSISNEDLKDISFDSLKSIECIKIEYSNYYPICNRIVDKRILKE